MSDLDLAQLDRGQLERLVGAALAALVERSLPTQPDRLLDPGQAAERLGITRQRVLELGRSGTIPSRAVGRHVMFRESDLSAFVASDTPVPLAPRGRAQESAPPPLAAARRRLRAASAEPAVHQKA